MRPSWAERTGTEWFSLSNHWMAPLIFGGRVALRTDEWHTSWFCCTRQGAIHKWRQKRREGGGCPNSDAVKEVVWFYFRVLDILVYTEPEKMACSCLGPSLVANHFFGPCRLVQNADKGGGVKNAKNLDNGPQTVRLNVWRQSCLFQPNWLGLSPNHDSGLGDSNQIPLFPRLGFDSNHFLMIL